MDLIRLPSSSEKILIELVQSDNPVHMLCNYFEHASRSEDIELRGILKELRTKGYVEIKWASNLPYIVTLNNSARTYYEQVAELEEDRKRSTTQEMAERSTIFISHRSNDKEIADMLVDFFSGTGIPREAVFCSSLPGNDIDERISNEIKAALKRSAVNIAILSQGYYQSAYCMNEAGVLWYEDVPVIPIALPEINSNSMLGFLNNEYKLRRLDSDTDVSYIYDIVREAVSAQHVKTSIITRENNKIRERYAELMKTRKLQKSSPAILHSGETLAITTDDERIVLYYILLKSVRKVSKQVISQWLNENEIYDVNIDNGFDLLSSFIGGDVNGDILELGIEAFRKYSANATSVLSELKEYVDRHTKLAVNTFKDIWGSSVLDAVLKLLIAYIIDEKVQAFGCRWMADGQIASIKQWEEKNMLDSVLSSNYETGLEFLIQNHLVFESGWTSYGNPREYTLCPSLQEFLFKCPVELKEELNMVKEKHIGLPY